MLLPDVCTTIILVWPVLSLLKLAPVPFSFISFSCDLCVCVCVVPSKCLQIAGSTKLVAPSLSPPAPATIGAAAGIATAIAALAAFLAECIQHYHTKA